MSADTLARGYTQKAIDTIAEVMQDGFAEDRDRLNAAKIMLDRGHGVASQATIAIPMNRKAAALLATMSDDDLMAIIRAAPLPRLRAIEYDGSDPIEGDFAVVTKDPLLE